MEGSADERSSENDIVTGVELDRNQRQGRYLVTGWKEMAKNATGIPCFSKSMGWGGVCGVATACGYKCFFSGSLFDGFMGGFLFVSVATWLYCRRNYEQLHQMTRKLMIAQSKPVNMDQVADASKLASNGDEVAQVRPLLRK